MEGYRTIDEQAKGNYEVSKDKSGGAWTARLVKERTRPKVKWKREKKEIVTLPPY